MSDNQDRNVIAYTSITLKGSQLAYTTSEKEYQLTQWFCLHGSIPFKRGDSLNLGYKVCVPKTRVVKLVTAYHENNGHFGRSKTYNQIPEKFYWPKMQRQKPRSILSDDGPQFSGKYWSRIIRSKIYQ